MVKIPQFPEFVQLGIEHRKAVEEYLAKNPPEASELNFTEIFAWRPVRNTKISLHNCTLCISFEKKGHQYYAVAECGNPLAETVEALLLRSRQEKHEAEVCFFTEEQAKKLEAAGKDFIIATERASSDYVYLASDLIELKGRKYDGKRNQIKQFIRNYSFELIPITQETMGMAAAFQKLWCEKKPCAPGTMLADESVAIDEMFGSFSKLAIFGAILKVNGKPAGYTLAGGLNSNTAVVYVEKALHEFKGIYQALNQMFAEKFLAKYRFINREQDVGDDGLRHAKMSYHPYKLVHKYGVKLKS
jgi:uncharacterized protein